MKCDKAFSKATAKAFSKAAAAAKEAAIAQDIGEDNGGYTLIWIMCFAIVWRSEMNLAP